MKAEFWVKRWQANQIGFHQNQVNPYLLQYWPQMALSADSEVFVPLAGKSLDMWWLREQGHRVLGVELSPIAVSDFFSAADVVPERTQNGPFEQCASDGVTLLCGDFFALDRALMAGISAVFDRASLVAMPADMRPDYAAHLMAILPDKCPILLVTMEYPEDQMQGPPFPVSEDEVRRLFAPHYRIQRLLQQDVLEQEAHFRERGLTSLVEKVFLLTPH